MRLGRTKRKVYYLIMAVLLMGYGYGYKQKHMTKFKWTVTVILFVVFLALSWGFLTWIPNGVPLPLWVQLLGLALLWLLYAGIIHAIYG